MRIRTFALAVALALLAAAPYWQVHRHPFLHFDDDLYVTKNMVVQQGLTTATARWALTATEAANWHPLTWWSHLLDVRLFGLDAGAHHLISVALHALNTALVFLVLLRMTAAPWRSAVVAALFALHPLGVEAVAWIAQRKTVLCTLFALLACWSYAGWVQRGGVWRYVLVLLGSAVSLMAKPMFVTLPFVLLLFDYWPLARRATFGRLVAEKVPLFAVSVAGAVMTYVTQQQAGAMHEQRALAGRLANAMVAYADYVRTTVWPVDLAVLYPLPEHWPLETIGAAAAVLLAITAAALGLRRHHPHLLVGWLLFLGTLVPVIGLVQVGYQTRADRYVYFPMIGLFVMAAWSLPARRAAAVVVAAVLVGVGGLTWRQVGYWQSSRTLFEHTLAVTPPSAVVHHNLGMALLDAADEAGATTQFEAAIAVRPDFALAHAGLAHVLGAQGKLADALPRQLEAVRLWPENPDLHYSLALVYAGQRRHAEAVAAYREAIRLRPNYLEALVDLANELSNADRKPEAIEVYRTVLDLAPGLPLARHNLGWLLLAKSDRSADDVALAITSLEEANALTRRQDPRMLDTLAVAHAIARHFDAAIEIDAAALALAEAGDDPGLVEEIQQNLTRFREMRATAATAPAT